MPLAVIGAGATFSALAASRSPAPLSVEQLAGLPALAVLMLVVVRAAAGPSGRTGDLVVTLLAAFLVALHALLLASSLGVVEGERLGVPFAAAGLFVALAPVIATLEPSSPMGLRTRATLGSAAVWRRAHRRLGGAFAAAGILGAAAAWLGGEVSAVAVMGGIPALAMLAAGAAAQREHRADAPRPTVERD
jgi:uncharacterized membrane protein